MPKIIRILRSCTMKIFSKFPTVNISKLNFWLVICIAKNFIWTTLKMIFSIFWFFCSLRFQIYKYCPIITNHTSMERLFIMYTVVAKIIRTQFKSVISIFCCSVSVGNINFAINCNNPVRFLSDLIIIQSVWNDMKKLRQTKSRKTESQDASRNLLQSSWETLLTHTHTHTRTHTHTDPEELCLKTLQETSCKAPEKLCSSAPRTKPALNTKMLTANVDLV